MAGAGDRLVCNVRSQGFPTFTHEVRFTDSLGVLSVRDRDGGRNTRFLPVCSPQMRAALLPGGRLEATDPIIPIRSSSLENSIGA